jgi:hypothetical protein
MKYIRPTVPIDVNKISSSCKSDLLLIKLNVLSLILSVFSSKKIPELMFLLETYQIFASLGFNLKLSRGFKPVLIC